jgi:hypothetical protein
VFAATWQEIDHVLDILKAIKPEVDPLTILPPEFHEFAEVFSRKATDQLLPHHAYNNKIVLEEGMFPPKSPIYSMSSEELQALRKFLDTNLSKRLFCASSLPVASPDLFLKNPNSDLCLFVDNLKLNAIRINNRYPLPLIKETLDRLASAKYYTKLDIIAACNKLRITPGHKYLTAFYTGNRQ